jgi:hypothetical protein
VAAAAVAEAATVAVVAIATKSIPSHSLQAGPVTRAGFFSAWMSQPPGETPGQCPGRFRGAPPGGSAVTG